MSKKTKEKQINTGISIYELNKKGMDLYKPLNEYEAHAAINNALSDLWVKEYLMLLCNERRDFTLFKNSSREIDKLSDEILETLNNRGEIIDITAQENNAVEIWIRDNKENFCYYLFDYSAAIVEV